MRYFYLSEWLPSIIAIAIGIGYTLIINYKTGKWKKDNEKEIKRLEGEVNQSNSTLNSAIQSYFASSEKLLDKRVEAYEALWGALMNTKNSFSNPIYDIYNFLTDEEIDADNAFDRISATFMMEDKISNNNIKGDLDGISNNIALMNQYMPYISSNSHTLLIVYAKAIGRISYNFYKEYSKQSIYSWKKDKPLMRLLSHALTKKEIEYINNIQLSSLATAINTIEYKILQEIQQSLNISHSAEDAIEHVKRTKDLMKGI